jgi:hypothetical protein
VLALLRIGEQSQALVLPTRRPFDFWDEEKPINSGAGQAHQDLRLPMSLFITSQKANIALHQV